MLALWCLKQCYRVKRLSSQHSIMKCALWMSPALKVNTLTLVPVLANIITIVLIETKQRFSQLFSVHVYSVQKAYLKVSPYHWMVTATKHVCLAFVSIGLWCTVCCWLWCYKGAHWRLFKVKWDFLLLSLVEKSYNTYIRFEGKKGSFCYWFYAIFVLSRLKWSQR